jgi:hypothetical protein
VAKVGTSNPYCTISLKRLQCAVENNKSHVNNDPTGCIKIPGFMGDIMAVRENKFLRD